MIKNRKELADFILKESKYYVNDYYSTKDIARLTLRRQHEYFYIRKYLIFLRKSEYYNYLAENGGFFSKVLALFYENRKNTLGAELGFSIPNNVLGKGVVIYHHGSIVINRNAIVGESCKFHGNNCIGNNGFSSLAPLLGKGVNIGFGAVILGAVEIADDVVIGANAVVTKSFTERGITIAGIPARRIK